MKMEVYLKVEQLSVEIHPDYTAMSRAASRAAAGLLQQALEARGSARVIFAVAPSQYGVLEGLAQSGLDFSHVTCFHMDEYLGLETTHPGSLARKLWEKLIRHVQPTTFNALEGTAPDVLGECHRYAQLLAQAPIDLCVLGIGENGHLAFNEPHIADFDDPVLVKTVRLDEKSRLQQAREKTFGALEQVPLHALTLTIPALFGAKALVGAVPGSHKAQAVRATLEGSLTPLCPASILRRHPKAQLHLDADSAQLLNK